MQLNLGRALPYLSPVYSADDTAPLRAIGGLDAPVARVFSSTLIVHYMIDEPGALVFVRERDIEPTSLEELHDRALANLRAHLKRRKLRFERAPSGAMFFARLDGQHDASLLLLDELWDPPTSVADLPGELIAAAPARNTLVFTGSGVRGGVAELRETVARTSDRALSPELFARRAGIWEPFDR